MPVPVSGYLTSEEAATLLGIKRTTLYSYAARGLVQIAAPKSGRHRLYLASDVERLRKRSAAAKGHGAAAATALEWGNPVLESAITSIDVDGPNYRGRPALTLAEEGIPFESVATLLWTGALPENGPGCCASDLGVPMDTLATMIRPGCPPTVILSVLIPLLAAADPLRHATTEVAELGRGRRLLRRMVASLALCGARSDWKARADRALGAPTLADGVLQALDGSGERARDTVDRALVLCADHELNPSTFAARIAAGTGADLYATVQAALSTLSGPRHGGASDRVEAMIDDAMGHDDVADWLGERLRRGDPVPGFGHRLYPDGDPRAEALLSPVHPGENPRLQVLWALVDAMVGSGHPPPNLDVGLVATRLAAGLPRGSAAALFAVGRTAGWIAHAREQRGSGQMVRPRARYVGP